MATDGNSGGRRESGGQATGRPAGEFEAAEAIEPLQNGSNPRCANSPIARQALSRRPPDATTELRPGTSERFNQGRVASSASRCGSAPGGAVECEAQQRQLEWRQRLSRIFTELPDLQPLQRLPVPTTGYPSWLWPYLLSLIRYRLGPARSMVKSTSTCITTRTCSTRPPWCATTTTARITATTDIRRVSSETAGPSARRAGLRRRRIRGNGRRIRRDSSSLCDSKVASIRSSSCSPATSRSTSTFASRLVRRSRIGPISFRSSNPRLNSQFPTPKGLRLLTTWEL